MPRMTTTVLHTTTGRFATRAKTIAFARHFGEMLVAMIPGMALVGLFSGGLGVAAQTLAMAAGMSASMAGWMRYRRHGWAPVAEMTGAMFAPAIAAIGLYWGGVLGAGGVMAVEHAGMLPAMLAVMLWRLDEYTGHQHS